MSELSAEAQLILEDQVCDEAPDHSSVVIGMHDFINVLVSKNAELKADGHKLRIVAEAARILHSRASQGPHGWEVMTHDLMFLETALTTAGYLKEGE